MLIAVALGFAVINGANDGGAIVAAGLKTPGLRPLAAIAVLAAAVAVVPLVWGTGVASTLVEGLVSASADVRGVLVGIGAVSAVAVVGVLSLRGLPTSLTLAVVGGIVGAALGAGSAVEWRTVGLVALIALVAPLAGGFIGHLLARLPLWLRGRDVTLRRLAWTQTGAFGLQSLAYAANDGQKMYAVLAVAGAAGADSPPAWQFVAVAALFSVGVLAGLRPAAGMLGRGVHNSTAREQIIAEFSSATAVLGSAAVGAPVSMTQSLSGSLVGVGVTRGYRRVRWRAALRLGAAWVITLPSSAAVGATMAAVGGVG